MPEPLILPGAEPFLFPGSRTGCLLVHGLTGTPREMRWMGEDLASRGYSVLAPRLAGHATCPDDLPRTCWRDWLAVVEDGFHQLRSCCDHVFILGLSLGGVLTLSAAACLPVSGAVAMSTPYDLPSDWRLNFLPIFMRLIPHVAKGPADWRNPDAARDHLEYPDYPTAAIAQLKDLLAEMRARLPSVRVPVLLIHSRLDQGVSPENMPRIYERLGTQDRQMLWVENSGHVIVREPDRQIVFQAAHEFIQRCLQGADRSESQAAPAPARL